MHVGIREGAAHGLGATSISWQAGDRRRRELSVLCDVVFCLDGDVWHVVADISHEQHTSPKDDGAEALLLIL